MLYITHVTGEGKRPRSGASAVGSNCTRTGGAPESSAEDRSTRGSHFGLKAALGGRCLLSSYTRDRPREVSGVRSSDAGQVARPRFKFTLCRALMPQAQLFLLPGACEGRGHVITFGYLGLSTRTALGLVAGSALGLSHLPSTGGDKQKATRGAGGRSRAQVRGLLARRPELCVPRPRGGLQSCIRCHQRCCWPHGKAPAHPQVQPLLPSLPSGGVGLLLEGLPWEPWGKACPDFNSLLRASPISQGHSPCGCAPSQHCPVTRTTSH